MSFGISDLKSRIPSLAGSALRTECGDPCHPSHPWPFWEHIAVVSASVVLLGPAAAPTHGQTADRPVAAPSEASAPTGEPEAGNDWSFSASAYGYFIPDDREYVQPTVTADRGWLHLEARYNYEDLETGSAWVGYNFGGGEKPAWEFTPMLGGVFGNTTGIAPGYRGSLSWWRLELYSEGEYVIDTGDSSESFFYNWSELTLAPVDWFRFGLVTQRTRAYETDREIQRGLLAGLNYKAASLTVYVFNPDDSPPTVVLAVGLEF